MCEREAIGQRMEVRGTCDGELGVRARARGLAAIAAEVHAIPRGEPIHAAAGRDDFAGAVEARDVRGRRLSRVRAGADVAVDRVDSRGADPDQDLAVARLGIRHFFELQNLGSAVLSNENRAHNLTLVVRLKADSTGPLRDRTVVESGFSRTRAFRLQPNPSRPGFSRTRPGFSRRCSRPRTRSAGCYHELFNVSGETPPHGRRESR